MEAKELKAPSSINHLPNGLLELVSLSELDAIMLSMLTPITQKQWRANADDKQVSHV
jgi:hypothetical protein